MVSPSLRTELCGVEFRNPTVLPSGFLGISSASLAKVARCGAGAVTFKSLGPVPRNGNPNPTVIQFEGGLINAVGLPNPGVDNALESLRHSKERLNVPLIASFFANNVEDFEMVARKITRVNPDLLELNLSCPHSETGVSKSFAVDTELVSEAVRAVKKVAKQPVLAKLSPNNPALKEMGIAVEEAGADGITAINTLGPGMVIDVVSRRPILANKFGGVSGPAIKPIAVRCVYDLYPVVKIPIIGTGGVSTGEDVVEMMMAGASAVGMGSSVFTRGIEVFDTVCAEVVAFLKEQGYSSVKELIGLAHEGGGDG